MIRLALSLFVLVAVVFALSTTDAAIPIHQHSLEPPLLINYEESGFPFWTIGKSSVAADSYVRLTPAPGKGHGYLWNKHPAELRQWKANFTVRQGGKPQGFHIFSTGDNNCKTCGSAFWYVADQARHGTSSFFGIQNRFRGFGIVFPSDRAQLHLVQSDGQMPASSLEEVSIASCPFTLDNIPRVIVVTYQAGGFVSISYAPADKPTYLVQCTKNIQVSYVENRYYFGFTAVHTNPAYQGMDVMAMKTVGALENDADENTRANLRYDPDEDKRDKKLWDGKPDQPQNTNNQQQQQQQQNQNQQPQQQGNGEFY